MHSRPNHYVYPGITSPFILGAHRVVDEMINEFGEPLPVTDGINYIIEKVFCIDSYLLLVKTRKNDIVFPRQVGMLLLRLANYSLSKSGAIYGKDHATALYAVKKKCYPILETKSTKDEYYNLVCSIKAFNILYPKYSLSDLPRGWDNFNERIYKPQPRH